MIHLEKATFEKVDEIVAGLTHSPTYRGGGLLADPLLNLCYN